MPHCWPDQFTQFAAVVASVGGLILAASSGLVLAVKWTKAAVAKTVASVAVLSALMGMFAFTEADALRFLPIFARDLYAERLRCSGSMVQSR